MWTQRALIAVTLLLSATSFAAELPLAARSSPFEDAIVKSSGEPVRGNPGPYTGHGYIVASPVNSGETGVVFKTYEVTVNQGRFFDDPSYLGSNFNLSIDDRNTGLFKRFQAIEHRNHELFVFEYDYKSHWNPEVESSHYFLTNIYTVEEFLTKVGGRNIPKGIQSTRPWNGSNGTKKKVGRIVDIEREGVIGDFCVAEVNLGGLSGNKSEGASVESIVKLAVTEEDVCTWIEKALAHARDVEVDISQDFIETWQPSSMFITAIQFKESSSQTRSQTHLETGHMSDADYRALKQRLLNDPDFLKQMINSHR